MTVEERFERIEHVTAMLTEERKKDREEYRQLWRDTQRAIAETNRQIAETEVQVRQTEIQILKTNAVLEDFMAETNRRFLAVENTLDTRIGDLVLAIGKLLAKEGK